MSWRLLTERAVSHDRGLALDDALTRCAADVQTPTLRLYTYESCVLVGRFQNVSNEVRLNHCETFKVPVNRRPSGGGAIIMGPEQLGIALIIPVKASGFSSRSSDLMVQCARGLIKALESLGIESRFTGKNDLVTRRRKIAGLGIYKPPGGAHLFHASLLLDLDIANMLRLLRLPFHCDDEEENRKAIEQRMTTVRRELDQDFSMDELAWRLQSGFEQAFNVCIEPSPLWTEEVNLAEKLYADQYSKSEWVYGNTISLRDRLGQSSIRTEAGRLEIKAIVAGETVKSVFLGGNFIASDSAVYDLESSLRWHVREPVAIKNTIAQSVARNIQGWDRISVKEITETLLHALKLSETLPNEATAGACFAREPAQLT